MIIKKTSYNYVLIILNTKCEKNELNYFLHIIMYKENKFKGIVDQIAEIF